MDIWSYGQKIADLAPRLFDAIPMRFTSRRTVQEAFTNSRWVSDITGALFVGVLLDIFTFGIWFQILCCSPNNCPMWKVSIFLVLLLMGFIQLKLPMKDCLLVLSPSAIIKGFGELGLLEYMARPMWPM
jgi:hypothetical protein